MRSLRSLIENLRGLVETKLTPEITYQVVNYHPGDFRGAGAARGEFSIAVSNGFAIKDDLKKLGFTFDPPTKDWVLKHVRMDLMYPASGKLKAFLARQPSEKAVQAAVPKVTQLVKAANEQIVAANQAKLSQAGIGGDDPRGTAQDVADWSDRQARSIKTLAKQGVVITHEYDTGVGGFRKGGGVGRVRVKGNTFPLKDMLKKAGFRWDGPSKSWEISSRSFTDDMLAKMVQVWGKIDDEEDEHERYKTGLSRSEPPGYDPNWEGEETPPWLA